MRQMDPLQVAMTGVKRGERYLQLFCSDTALTQGLAAKTGLSGVAALWAPDREHAARAEKAAHKAGALIDVQVTAPAVMPWPPDSFDMVVIDNTAGDFATMTGANRAALFLSARRALRQGGRVELIERVRDTSTSEEALRTAGFRGVRTLAERDGFRFVEAQNS